MLGDKIRQDRKGYQQLLYDQHMERLQNAKSFIGNSKPIRLHMSKKWETEYNRKIDKINYSNYKLVDRLINVKSCLDNKPDKHMKEVIEFKNKMIIHKRNHEMEKIIDENIQLTERLKNIKPTILF